MPTYASHTERSPLTRTAIIERFESELNQAATVVLSLRVAPPTFSTEHPEWQLRLRPSAPSRFDLAVRRLRYRGSDPARQRAFGFPADADGFVTVARVEGPSALAILQRVELVLEWVEVTPAPLSRENAAAATPAAALGARDPALLELVVAATRDENSPRGGQPLSQT